MIKEILLVGMGGFAGSAGRYLVSLWLSGAKWLLPVAAGTFAVNAVGSLLIGLLLGALTPGNWWFLLVVGFCGGFTTFSAFSAEMLAMMRTGQIGYCILYALASVVVCLLAVWLGSAAGQQLVK